MTTLTDNSGLGNTYSEGSVVSASGRLALYRVKLAADLPIGTTFSVIQNGNNAPQFSANCFPSGTAFIDTTTAGALATNAAPTLTTGNIANSPEYVVYAMWSAGQINNAVTSGSFSHIGKVDGGGGFGILVAWQKYSGSTGVTLTYAPTNMASAVWGLTYNTGTAP